MDKTIKKMLSPNGEEIDVLCINSEEGVNICYPKACLEGAKYTFSIFCKGDSGGTVSLSGETLNEENQPQNPEVTTDWQRFIFKFQRNVQDSEDLILSIPKGNCDICMAQLETEETVTSWDYSANETREVLGSKIEQTAEAIISTVVGANNVISSINQTSEKIQISANKIDLNGAVTANDYFKIGTDGKVTITNGTIELTKENAAGATKTTVNGDGFQTYQTWSNVVDLRGDLFSGLRIYKYSDLNAVDSSQSLNNPMLYLDNHTICISKKSTLPGALATNGHTCMYENAFSTTDDNGNMSSLTPTSAMVGGDVYISGKLTVNGAKNRAVETEHFGTVLQNALETPTPAFSDYGEGKLSEEGSCRIFLDDKFLETVDPDTIMTVFLTKYGNGDIYVSDRQSSYFEVKGTPNLSFAWQVIMTQRDYNNVRLDENINDPTFDNESDLSNIGYEFLTEYEGDLMI